MPKQVDLLILRGSLMTMDQAGCMLEDAGLAVAGDRILALGRTEELRSQFSAVRTIDAQGKVVMPGLVDTYGHAGHGLIRGYHHPVHGWPAGRLYWHATTERWWYAEALLAATERLRFGVTTGASILGSVPPRTDSTVFGIRNAEAYAKVGVRAVLGVGPPDPFFSHLDEPWSGSFLEDGEWVERTFTYEDALQNSLEIIKTWHRGADGRIRMALAPPYLFGRVGGHPNRPTGFRYEPENIPVMIEKAEEIRSLADEYGVQIHTHMFQDVVDFAVKHFGRDRVERLLGSDVVVAHGNGLKPSEVEMIGGRRCNVATAPSTAENLWYDYAPVIELLEAGANVTISTDGSAPRFSFDLWKDIPRAMWHQWVRFDTQRVLPPGKALRMVTIDAAKALGMDEEVGSLEVGKKADVILVDLNRPHLTPKTFVPQLLTYYVNGNDVDTVLVDGKVLMEGGKIVSVDVDEVMDMAWEEAAKTFAKVDLTPYTQLDHDFWHGARY